VDTSRNGCQTPEPSRRCCARADIAIAVYKSRQWAEIERLKVPRRKG